MTQEEKDFATSQGTVAVEYPEIPTTEVAKKVGASAAKEAPVYIMKNVMRAIKEGWGMSQVQIDDLLRDLHDKGIGIVVISAVDDPVFPTDKMAQQVKAGTVDGFLSVRGGHGQIGEHPERYMVAAEQMLTAVERKRARLREPKAS